MPFKPKRGKLVAQFQAFFLKPGIAEAGLILKEHFLSLPEVVGLVTAEWHCLPDGKAKVGKVWPTFGLNGTGCTQEETNILPVCNNGGEAICGALGKGHMYLISVLNLR